MVKVPTRTCVVGYGFNPSYWESKIGASQFKASLGKKVSMTISHKIRQVRWHMSVVSATKGLQSEVNPSKSKRLYLKTKLKKKRQRAYVQVLECLPSKWEALSSNSSSKRNLNDSLSKANISCAFKKIILIMRGRNSGNRGTSFERNTNQEIGHWKNQLPTCRLCGFSGC